MNHKVRPFRFLVALVTASIVAASVWVPAAAAHSTLIRACPGSGDVLNDVDVLELEFRTPLIDDGEGNVDLLRSSDEYEPAVGPVVFTDDLLIVTVDVLEDLEPGRYVLRYQLTSGDGDDNDALNLSDALAILRAFFGTPVVPLPAPGAACGVDVAGTTLDCAMPTCP